MPITIKYAGSPALTGLAAYGGGQAKYRADQQRAWMPIIAQRQQMQFEAQQAAQRQQAQLEYQGRQFGQENAIVKAGQEFHAAEADKQRTWGREGQNLDFQQQWQRDEEQRRFVMEGRGVEFGQQQQRDTTQFGFQQQLQEANWKARRDAELEGSLTSGDAYYSDEQKRMMDEKLSAMDSLRSNPRMDDNAKAEGLGKLQQQYDAIRYRPHTARGDQRALTPEERSRQNFQVLPTGERLYTQPDGKVIQLRPEPAAKPEKPAANALSDPSKYDSAYKSAYGQLVTERNNAITKAQTEAGETATPPTEAEVLDRMKRTGWDAATFPNAREVNGPGGGVGGWDSPQSGPVVAPRQLPDPGGTANPGTGFESLQPKQISGPTAGGGAAPVAAVPTLPELERQLAAADAKQAAAAEQYRVYTQANHAGDWDAAFADSSPEATALKAQNLATRNEQSRLEKAVSAAKASGLQGGQPQQPNLSGYTPHLLPAKVGPSGLPRSSLVDTGTPGQTGQLPPGAIDRGDGTVEYNGRVFRRRQQ
jgi:hypothetical protein